VRRTRTASAARGAARPRRACDRGQVAEEMGGLGHTGRLRRLGAVEPGAPILSGHAVCCRTGITATTSGMSRRMRVSARSTVPSILVSILVED